MSLAAVSARVIMRVLLDSVSLQPERMPLLHLRDAHITGALQLRHSTIGVPLVFENCTFDEPVTIRKSDVKALEFRSCTLPGFDGHALHVAGDLAITDTLVGWIDLFGARVGGQLWLNDSRVEGRDGGYAISAPQIEVAGGWYARRLTVRGGLNLWGAHIRAGLELDGAVLSAEDRPVLRAPKLTVTGDVTLGSAATISGAVDLSSVVIDGRLMLQHQANGQHEVTITDARVTTLHLEMWPPEHVEVDLTGAVVTPFVDVKELWPERLRLDRTQYQTLRPLLPARDRLGWLERNRDSDSPQPYEQLARQYREAGHDHDARTVLLAKYRNRTRRLRFPNKLWGHVQDLTVGYGYRPVRALAWLAGLTMLVGICSAIWQPRPITGTAPAFNPVVYSLDVVLPILDLGQEKAYNAVGFGRTIVWIAIVAGWLLASTVIASVTRSISRS
ncbi:hypothetical protein [Kibdelosporangium aridum]|uniref:hypothetical protein n=1 Tax=Kibdelosporangium aridum TaxID=2030 RepID=UPI00052643FE